MKSIQYPIEPPAQLPKPKLSNKKSPDSYGLWMTHDPAIFRDPVSKNYYIYSTNAQCKRSKDLLNWENLGKIVEKPPQESIAWTKSVAILLKLETSTVYIVPILHGACVSPAYFLRFRTLRKGRLYRAAACFRPLMKCQ